MRQQRAVRQTSSSSERGFTLIEVVVSLALILVGLMGLMEVAGLATAANVKSQLRDEAVLIGEEQMADLLRRPQAALPAFDAYSAPSRVRGSDLKYLVTRTTSAVPLTSSYRFTVNVSWSYKKVPYSHELQSLRTYAGN